MAANSEFVYLNPDDNICVATRFLTEKQPLNVRGHTITLSQPIKLGHKIAIQPIPKGTPVRKYGQVIGFATEPIAAGDWVHSHNVTMGDIQHDYAKSLHIPPAPKPLTGRAFQGYRRADGRAGSRNYLAVISTVNCSATVCKYIAKHFAGDELKAYPNVDGVIAFTHDSGCGLQFGGLQHKVLNRVLGGIAKHPNIGGYLLIGLGCEQGAMGYFLEDQRLIQIQGTTEKRAPGQSSVQTLSPPVFSMQDMGGTRKTVEAGIKQVRAMLPILNEAKRVSIPASEIVLGTNCGGSDGNSGITANPALGIASDMLVACGGTSILAETPEIYGAEHLLTRRAVTPVVAEKLLERIRWWLWHTGLYGVELDNNPSVGNKEGGLTTIAEKSLGAVAKAGSTALVDVYEYAEQVTAKGMVVMDTPGFDPVSVTGIVAGGANVVVFTTGRGSCFGCKPAPSIKIATNTPMYDRMVADMDINAGEILHGKSVEEVGRQIFEEILAVASGKKTKSEMEGIGDEEFAPWMIGPTL